MYQCGKLISMISKSQTDGVAIEMTFLTTLSHNNQSQQCTPPPKS